MEVFSSENGLYVKSLRFSTTTFMIQMTNLEHTNDPLPKAVGFIYFYENPFKMMNVSSSEKLFSFLRYLQFSHGCLKM